METYINEFHNLVRLTYKLDKLINLIDQGKETYDIRIYFLSKKIQKFLNYYLLNTEIKMNADYDTEIPRWINNIDRFIVQPTIKGQNKKSVYNCQRMMMLHLNLLIRNSCLKKKIEFNSLMSSKTTEMMFDYYLREALN